MNIAENPVAIVGPQYCAPHQIDLTIKKKSTFSSPYRFVITDDNNNIIFNVKPASSFSSNKVIFDAAGNPILTLSRNFFSATWKAYRGESSDEKDLIFSAKGPKMFHPNTKLRVYMANNSSQDVPDFKVKGSMYKKASMAIYVGESSTIVAQVQNKLSDLQYSRKNTAVTVYANTDQVFVVAMMVLLATQLVSRRNSSAAAMNGGASAAATF